MAAATKVNDLLSLLEGQLSAVQAAVLLQDANGCIETAVADFFAAAESEVGGSASVTPSEDQWESKVLLLKAILPEVADSILMKHLKEAKGSVDRAADAYFKSQTFKSQNQPNGGSSATSNKIGPSIGQESTSRKESVGPWQVVAEEQKDEAIAASQSTPEERVGRRVKTTARKYAPVGWEAGGPSTAAALNLDSSEDEEEEEVAPRRRPKRKRVATVPFTRTKLTKPVSKPEVLVAKPPRALVASPSKDGFVVRLDNECEYPLPLKEHRTPAGRLFAEYGTELPDKVVPAKQLELDFPGVHLGSFCMKLTDDAAKAIRENSGFVEVAWASVVSWKHLALIDGDGRPDGVYQGTEEDDTMVIELEGFAKMSGGFSQSVEAAVHTAHRDGLVRVFATLDNCGKKGGVKYTSKALEKFNAFTRKHHRATRGPSVFLHVCLTEKAVRYNHEDGGFEDRRNSKSRQHRHMLVIASALRSYGFGLELGPDSDELLNFGPDTAPSEAALSDQHFDLFNLLASIDLPETAPVAEHPPQLLTQPMKYQLKALAWMMTREGAAGGSVARRNVLTLHPCWQQLLTADGQVVYMQREEGACSQNFYLAPRQGTCGGLLCDEMGLGKTLEMLMLVLSHPPPPGWAVADAATWDKEDDVMPIKATLVVVPASLLDQWRREVELHVRPGALNVLHYEGRYRRGSAGKRAGEDWGMEKYDVIITSYEVIRTELAGSANSPLLTYGFWRVVLDEAQLVANSSSVAAVTASSIMRRHAWVVTGTPITSRLDELQGLLDFLAVQPFGEPGVFRSMIKLPYEARTAVGLQRLRVLLKSIMIRRTKAGVANEMTLPPCTTLDVNLSFSDAEASYYERVHESFVAAIKRMDRHQSNREIRRLEGFDPSNLGAKVTGQALASLTRLRQACCHPQIVRTGGEYLGKARLTMTQIMAKLVEQARGAHDAAARNWLVARVALAVAIAKQKQQTAADCFEHLLSDVTKCGALAIERSGLIKAPVDGDVETERATRQNATRGLYQRLELTVLTTFLAFLREDLADGEEVAERLASVADRISDLEDDLGITAERIALVEAGRKFTRAEQKKLDDEARQLAEEAGQLADQENALWRSVGFQRARAEAGEGSSGSGAGPSTLAAALEQSAVRLTRRGKRKIEEAFGGTAADAAPQPFKQSDYDKEIEEILEGPKTTRKARKPRTSEQRVTVATAAVTRAKEKMEELYRQEKHLDFKLDEMEKGRSQVGPDGASTSDAGGSALPGEFLLTEHTVIQEDKTQCPICLDSCEDCGAVTICGHYFCSDCIHEYIQSKGADAPCPLCRQKLKTKDVFNACKEPERKQGELPDLSGEYGTKISALVSELISIRERDPAAKSVIFSSWRLLLNLAGEALATNGLRCVVLWGRPEERQQALKAFSEDPEVRAILVLMGMSGGAAGLTLTAASTAFILEPSVNPGMELQAAARIHRLSQDRPTRVVRFIVNKTIEPRIVKLQAKKLEMGGSSGGNVVMEQLRGQDLLELIEDDRKGKQPAEE